MPSAFQSNLIAVLALAALALVLFGCAVRQRRQLRLTRAQSFWYCVNYLFTRLLWRARVDGELSVAPEQGAILVCNHRSSVDPCFIEIATNRAVHWMVAKEYFAHWALGRFLRLAVTIPTNRGAIDTQATKMAIRYAQRGELVGVLPEGKINRTERLLLPGRPGAAMIALKARVPVIPCYIQGAPYDGSTLGCLLMPAKVTVRIGDPIDLSEFYGREDEREVVEQLTRRVLCSIAALADQPGFRPELAGKRAGRP
jgi:1-acyl-sn-glycerol-3-phosphate acyltransferase